MLIANNFIAKYCLSQDLNLELRIKYFFQKYAKNQINLNY